MTIKTVAHRSVANCTAGFRSCDAHGSVAMNLVFDKSRRQLSPALVKKRPLILRLPCQGPRASIGFVEFEETFGVADEARFFLWELDRFLQVVGFYPCAQSAVIFELAFAKAFMDVDKDLQVDETIMLGKLQGV